jgi:hypothetical protein
MWRWAGALVGGLMGLVGGGIYLQWQAAAVAAGTAQQAHSLLLYCGWCLAVGGGVLLGLVAGALADWILARRP